MMSLRSISIFLISILNVNGRMRNSRSCSATVQCVDRSKPMSMVIEGFPGPEGLRGPTGRPGSAGPRGWNGPPGT